MGNAIIRHSTKKQQYGIKSVHSWLNSLKQWQPWHSTRRGHRNVTIISRVTWQPSLKVPTDPSHRVNLIYFLCWCGTWWHMSMRAFKHLRIDLQRLSACGRTALDYSLSLSWGNWQITGADIQWRDLFKPAHSGSAEEGWGFECCLQRQRKALPCCAAMASGMVDLRRVAWSLWVAAGCQSLC